MHGGDARGIEHRRGCDDLRVAASHAAVNTSGRRERFGLAAIESDFEDMQFGRIVGRSNNGVGGRHRHDRPELDAGGGDGFAIDREATGVCLVVVCNREQAVAEAARCAGHKFGPARVDVTMKFRDVAGAVVDGHNGGRLLVPRLHREPDAIAAGPVGPSQVFEFAPAPINWCLAPVESDDEKVDRCIGGAGSRIGERPGCD